MTGSGAAVPFILDDFNLEDLTESFDPITTLCDADFVSPTQMPEERADAKYARAGFLVRPNADGAIYVITWRQFQAAIKKDMTRTERVTALGTLEGKKWNGLAGQWLEVPVVKVFGVSGDDAGHSLTIATECEIGIIL